MRLTLMVFDALAAAPLPCTRSDIERVTGLPGPSVREALRILRRHQLLEAVGGERERVLYRLVHGAGRPDDGRGRYERTTTHRALQQTLRLAHMGKACAMPATYRAARQPAPRVMVGRAHAVAAADGCLLDRIWRAHKRKRAP